METKNVTQTIQNNLIRQIIRVENMEHVAKATIETLLCMTVIQLTHTLDTVTTKHNTLNT